MTREWVIVGFALVVCLAFTGLVVNYSFAHGRLAFPPYYDDSHSLVEGALRWLTLKQMGIGAAWEEYLQRPPHSFLHYYFAAASFALFGIHAGVVYWTGALFLLTAMLGLIGLLQGVPVPRTVPLLSAFLSVPVIFNLIFDFRSECALAALLFAACCAIVRAALADHCSYRRSAMAGVLLALSLGIKPAMFPYSLGMALAASFMLWVCARARPGGAAPRGWRGVSVIWAWMILPFAFHYALNWDRISGYILDVAFKSDYYKQSGALTAQLLYHFLGFPGRLQLGVYAWPLLIITLAANLMAAVASGSVRSALRWRLHCCSFLALVAYAGVAVNAMVQNYFGMTFHLLLVASALLGIAYLAERMPRRAGDLLCVAAVVAAVIGWQVPISQDYLEETLSVGGADAVSWRREAPARVFEAIRPYWWRDGSPPVVWVATYGWTDGNTLSWEAVQRELHWKIWNYYEMPPAAGTLFPAEAEILVVPEPGVMGSIDLPCNQSLPEVRRALDADGSTRLIAEVADPRGKAFRIYRRESIAARPPGYLPEHPPR